MKMNPIITKMNMIQIFLPGNNQVVEFIKIVNDGFDFLIRDFSYHSSNKLNCTDGINLNKQNITLNNYMICDLNSCKKETVVIFLISICSIQGLYNELQ